MSDNMERDKNERLNAMKIEEEEMKRELTGIGIYEPGITYDQMKQILGFLNESENTSSGVAFNNRNTQKEAKYSDNECLPDARSDTNASQESAELSRPSYAYKVNRASPTAHTERKTVRYSSSPESSPLYEVRNPTYRRKSSDSDEPAEKQHEGGANTANTHSTNRFYSLRSGNCAQTATTYEKKTTGQATGQDEVVQKLEKWRLNPLDICINENDVPLQQPCRPSARERAPFGCCKEASTSEQCDEVARALSQHLMEMAALRYSWHPPASSVFQWGSPIQVGTANGNLDRKPLTDSKTEQIKAESMYRDRHELRASKRKTSSLIADFNKENSSGDERDDQYDFVRVKKKKKKIQSSSKSSNIEQHRAAYQHVNHEGTTSNVLVRQQHPLNDNDNNDVNPEDEDTESPHAEREANEEENLQLSPELTIYPRRIVPPNPKARLSLDEFRQRRENLGTSKPSPKIRRIDGSKDVDQAKHRKKDTMTDKEIRRTLEEDWSGEQKDEVAPTTDLEIRPLSITKEVRSRLHKKRSLSNNTEMTSERRVTMREEESKQERNKEKQLRIIREEKRKEEELSRIDNRNGSWEHQLLSNDEDESTSEMNQESDTRNNKESANISISSSNVRCPICNKLFSHNEIENHAADCEQFEADDEGKDNDADQLECNICNNYKTNNGIDYEQHVHDCIRNRIDKKHSHESKTVNTDFASTSSTFKNYKPISEQKDSEIDYLGQFPSNSRTKTYNTGRKRKR